MSVKVPPVSMPIRKRGCVVAGTGGSPRWRKHACARSRSQKAIGDATIGFSDGGAASSAGRAKRARPGAQKSYFPALATLGRDTTHTLILQRLAHRGEEALLAARQRLAPSEQAERDAARRRNRKRLEHSERDLVAGGRTRHDRKALSRLHDRFHGLDVVGDRKDVRAD